MTEFRYQISEFLPDLAFVDMSEGDETELIADL
jgi:hypothetical protein